MSKISIFCTARSESEAGRIIDDLKSSYYSKHDISALCPEKQAAHLRMDAPEAPGQVLDWLAGIGTVPVPGLGKCLAAGPLMTTLDEAARDGTLSGAAYALANFGIPDHQATHYEDRLKAGNILIGVHTKDPTAANFAREIFKQQGAADITSTAEAPPRNDTLAERRRSSFTPLRFRFW